MVTITEISRIRSAACIILDTGEKYWIRYDDLSDAGFYPGRTYNAEEFIQQIQVLQYPRALNSAVAMLARRPCSKGEIISRLKQRRFAEDVAELVIYKLEKEKLLDDRDFCEQWIRYRQNCKYGVSFIRRELISKGIPEDLIEFALANREISDEQINAELLAEKAWKRLKPDEDRHRSREKVIASLLRRGYGWDLAKTACDVAEKRIK